MSVLGGVVLTLVFILVFVWTRAALGASEAFARGPKSLTALCVAGLSVAGLVVGFHPVRAGESGLRESPLVHFILLPYAALGLTLLIAPLLALLLRLAIRMSSRARRHKAPDARSDQPAGSSRPVNRWANRQ